MRLLDQEGPLIARKNTIEQTRVDQIKRLPVKWKRILCHIKSAKLRSERIFSLRE
ncbi:hypothetical protein KSD_74440 [Ktedonobacter sp. SOSP1-85]|nr:hypothetical protein [Ktedonobacter sp. SOSP1-85]GHO79673.1 hypothetical protein KSD_74440 [Ktedonobacter sp. SOSP1-85]